VSDDGSVAATYCATLVDEWARRGCRFAVISPGSRSTPMAMALDADERISVSVHHDERAGAFMALGIGRVTGDPAVMLTTSGTAAVELHPAVVEADHAGVPLLAVTADRPPELIGTGAPQTIDQRDLYGTSVRWFCQPGPPDRRGAEMWRDLAIDAYDRTRGIPPGPVHLNLAFAEPLVGVPGPLPAPVVRARPILPDVALSDEALARLSEPMASAKGVIVAGERAALDPGECAAILAFAENRGWPVLADHLSGVRVDHPAVVPSFDPILRHVGDSAAFRPEVVVRLGALVASRVTNEWIDGSPAVVVGIDRWGRIPDPARRAAHRVTATPATILDQLRPLVAPDDHSDWLRRWATASDAATQVIVATRGGEPAVMAEVVRGAPTGSTVMVASSMPVRDLEWFVGPRPEVAFHSNRGANGIDGVVSSAVGMAVAGRPTIAVVGDVAFLHDSNSLIGLGRRGVDLLVVVIDNDGGGIFSFLPQATELAPPVFERLFGTPHGTDLAGMARAHGLDVAVVDEVSGMAEVVAAWAERGGVRVAVVRSDRAANVATHREIGDAVGHALRERFDLS
jgi:2-succinyl-5-enolpyruvyl-6-hydroxy-3-cyclohexene-1-carboxylate synthase